MLQRCLLYVNASMNLDKNDKNVCVIVDFEDNIVVMKYVVICYKLNYL